MQSTTPQTVSGECQHADLLHIIEHAAHLLPAQGPITSFVHHNTLHAFEDLSFENAVVKGAETFGCHPYLPEERYRQKLARGRILQRDIEAELIDDLDNEGDELLGFLGTRFHLRLAMLAHPLRTGPTAELHWVLSETEALRNFRKETPQPIRDRIISDTRQWVMRDLRNGHAAVGHDDRLGLTLDNVFAIFDKQNIEQWDDANWEMFTLHLLWLLCKDGVVRADVESPTPRRSMRHRDLLMETTGQDSDEFVHDLLIRYCAAFLDQGFANWSLPNQFDGFYRTFLWLYGQPFGMVDRWARNLRQELRRLVDEEIGPLDSIAESLALLGISEKEREEFITKTLLALRGFGGMIWQLESRGDRVAHPLQKGSLNEFLAVRLILDRVALQYVARESTAFSGPLCELRPHLLDKMPPQERTSVEQRTFLVFQLAQLIGWNPQHLHRLTDAEWKLLLSEVEAFSSLQRRRIYHLAFERRYRIQTLDAIAVHSQARRDNEGIASNQETSSPANSDSAPAFQVVCCIDEREESFRRHLEEVEPQCETLGAAGFFAVAMYYRGAADAHYTPLCPVMIKPQHYVGEDVIYNFKKTENQRRSRRRAIGTVTRRVHIGSRTFAGGWLAAVLGSLASIPLVTRILFPRATARMRRLFGGFVRTPAVTHLQLERTEAEPGSEPGHVGYNVNEMATIVERLLRDMGLTKCFSRLIVICGHGSSSMNNPHEAAHDCGACSGGRGGPNARAFAQMANDPRIRQLLDKNGLPIPNETVFLGAYHNTCDDSVTYYDLDRLPSTHEADFDRASAAIDEARKRSAHERCRRFESVELRLSTDAALRHVEGRSEDLSQVRPEYGHATNALCFVGRREWSRGLFLDRRAFLQSYEPEQDDEERTILTRILQPVIPVCAGINLEYYFSYVDPVGYGCGTKLPHNITSLVGVMNGAASDLRPGLPWQMVEIHEPVRVLFVVESTPNAMLQIMQRNPGLDNLIRGGWVQLATFDPQTSEIHLFRDGQFALYRPSTDELPDASSSIEWYRGWRDHLGFARIQSTPSSVEVAKPSDD